MNNQSTVYTVATSAGALALAIWLGRYDWTLALFFGLIAAGLATYFWDKTVGKWLIICVPAALGLFLVQGGVYGWFLALPCFFMTINAAREQAK